MVTLDQGGRGRGGLRLIAPPPRLRDTVEHFWVQQHPVAYAGALAWRIVADDAPCLVGHATANGSRLVLSGARTRHIDIDVSRRRLTVGVRLRPGAIPALFAEAAATFTDRSYGLCDVLGKGLAEVQDALASVDTRAAVSALAALLECRAACGKTVDTRVLALVAADGRRVGQTAQDLGLSERTARHLSTQHLGMGVKRLWRIRRLHRALRLGFSRPGIGWAEVAAETDYADQPHLIRDCRDFLGESPTVFAGRAS